MAQASSIPLAGLRRLKTAGKTGKNHEVINYAGHLSARARRL
jgi:hypothetical protein